jgi:hypothetical protein
MKVHQLFAKTVWKLENKKLGLKNKHPLLLNVCHYNLVQSFLAERFVPYIKDQVSHS